MLSLDPQYGGDVLEDVRRVGRATGTEAGYTLVNARTIWDAPTTLTE